MRPSQTSSARGCSLTCGTISRGCNCLRRWRWVKSKIIVKLLVLTNCPSGGSDIILEQQAGAPWSLRVGLRPRIFAVEGKILPAHIFTHPWSHWCGILSAQNRGSEKPITPVPIIQMLTNNAKEVQATKCSNVWYSTFEKLCLSSFWTRGRSLSFPRLLWQWQTLSQTRWW